LILFTEGSTWLVCIRRINDDSIFPSKASHGQWAPVDSFYAARFLVDAIIHYLWALDSVV